MIINFINEIKNFYQEVNASDLTKLSLEELQALNTKMEGFYKNPILGEKSTEEEKVYSTLAYTVLGFYPYFTTKSKYSKLYMEFLDKISSSLEISLESAKETMKEFFYDVSFKISKSIENNHLVDNEKRKIVLESDLDTINYLYYYGEHITENHLKIVDFFNNKVDEEKITGMAKCTIEAFLRGMKNSNIDDEKKTYVILCYPIGFEKLAKKIVEMLERKTRSSFKKSRISFLQTSRLQP